MSNEVYLFVFFLFKEPSVANSEVDEHHEKTHKKPFRLSFGKGKKKAKHGDDTKPDETQVSKSKKDKEKSSKTHSEEQHKDKSSSKPPDEASLPGKSLSEIVTQPTGEKLEEKSDSQSDMVQTSEVQKPEDERQAVEKPENDCPEAQKPGNEDHAVSKPVDEAENVKEDVIAPQDEITVEISPDVKAQKDKVNY